MNAVNKNDDDEPRKMLGVDEVLDIVPISRRTLERMASETRSAFPKGRFVKGRKMWFADEIAAWQHTLPTRKQRRKSGGDAA